RIGFDHISYTGGSAGFFLPVAQYTQNDLWNLRGRPIMFYYVILALTVAAFLLCHLLLRSRMGYFWLAIREDEDAARALGIDTFRYKMAAVTISAGMTELLHALGIDVPGAKQVFYGICLLVVVMALPDGIWPWLARRLGLERRT